MEINNSWGKKRKKITYKSGKNSFANLKFNCDVFVSSAL